MKIPPTTPNLALPVMKFYEMVDEYNINVREICILADVSETFFYRGKKDPASLNIATAQKIVNAISRWVWLKKNPRLTGEGEQ